MIAATQIFRVTLKLRPSSRGIAWIRSLQAAVAPHEERSEKTCLLRPPVLTVRNAAMILRRHPEVVKGRRLNKNKTAQIKSPCEIFVDRLGLHVDFACSALRMREVAHSRGEVGRVCAAGSHATAELPPCSNPDNNKGIGLLGAN